MVGTDSPSHVHSEKARRWFETCQDVRFYFSRFTQLGLLRLLTTPALMKGQVLQMDQAWQIFDRLNADPRIQFLNEPANFERHLRLHANSPTVSPKLWSDAYLVAFATSTGLKIVTFVRSFGAKAVDALVLGLC